MILCWISRSSVIGEVRRLYGPRAQRLVCLTRMSYAMAASETLSLCIRKLQRDARHIRLPTETCSELAQRPGRSASDTCNAGLSETQDLKNVSMPPDFCDPVYHQRSVNDTQHLAPQCAILLPLTGTGKPLVVVPQRHIPKLPILPTRQDQRP